MGERPEYAVVVEPLSAEDGGGFIATVPDLPGCMSDGETEMEAILNAQDAISCWLEANHDRHQQDPQPTSRRAFG
jgi:antitoxin HicB